MKKATEELPIRGFNVPPKIIFATIDKETGFLAKPSTPVEMRVRAAYLEGTEPTTTDAPKSAGPEDPYDLMDTNHEAGNPINPDEHDD